MEIGAGVACALIGLAVGSWLPLAAYRTPMRLRSWKGPAFHCGRCGTRASGGQGNAWRVRLGMSPRACRQCAAELWPRRPTAELATAALLALVGARAGWGAALPAFLVFFVGIGLITIVDLRTYLIPNRVLYPTLFATLALFAIAAIAVDRPDRLASALMGMVGGQIFFFIVWRIQPRGFGYGDVRLGGLVGLATGWLGIVNVVLGVMAGLVLGSLVGVLLVLAGNRGMKDAIPFGPFLCLGAAIAILFGAETASLLGY